MKNFKFILLILCLLYSCSTDYTIKTGVYEYHQVSELEYNILKIIRGIDSYAVGSELILNNDSTYKYTTCGNIITGTWFTKKDSLYLRVFGNRWRSDSLNKYGWDGTWPEISNKPICYQIRKKGRLEQITKSRNGHQMLEILDYKKSKNF